jgi:hypothetical protein
MIFVSQPMHVAGLGQVVAQSNTAMTDDASLDDTLRELQQQVTKLRELLARFGDDEDGAIGTGVRTRRDPPKLTGRAAVALPR